MSQRRMVSLPILFDHQQNAVQDGDILMVNATYILVTGGNKHGLMQGITVLIIMEVNWLP